MAYYDLGDSVALAIQVTDPAGALIDATSAVVTITRPDGTTISPTVDHTATGKYQASIVATGGGRYVARWVTTGPDHAYTEIFDVASVEAGLISLRDARTALRLAAGNTSSDEDLRTWIAAATPVIEDIVGPVIAQQHTDTFDGGGPTIHLPRSPLTAATITVTEAVGGGIVRTLAEQNLTAGHAATYGFSVDRGTGLVTRRCLGQVARFAPGARNITIVCTAGRDVVPPNVRLATMELVRHWWQLSQQGHRPSFGAAGDDPEWVPSGFAVPRRVIEICAGERAVPGIA